MVRYPVRRLLRLCLPNIDAVTQYDNDLCSTANSVVWRFGVLCLMVIIEVLGKSTSSTSPPWIDAVVRQCSVFDRKQSRLAIGRLTSLVVSVLLLPPSGKEIEWADLMMGYFASAARRDSEREEYTKVPRRSLTSSQGSQSTSVRHFHHHRSPPSQRSCPSHPTIRRWRVIWWLSVIAFRSGMCPMSMIGCRIIPRRSRFPSLYHRTILPGISSFDNATALTCWVRNRC